MAKITNNWKSAKTRIDNYEKLCKDNNTFDPFRCHFIITFKKEYFSFIKERNALNETHNLFLPKILNDQMVDMVKFIHENILDNMPLSQLIEMGSGSRIKDLVENFIVNDIMNIIRGENTLIDTYISAEPSLCEDDYWDECNWSWDMVYEGCGFTFDHLDSASINEFELLHNYLYHKDEMIANVKAKFGEKYFPTEKEFELTIKVKATSLDDAMGKIASAINEDGEQFKELIEFL